MSEDQNQDSEEEDDYFTELDPDTKIRPTCDACGDSVKVVFHSGIPKYAKHCKECYAELRWGKIPKMKRGKRYL